MDYNGDPSLVTKRDVMFLSRGFRQTYNALNKQLCDDKFREIHFVDAIAQDGGSPVIPRGGLSFGFRFLVKGVCRGCGPNANLFSPPLGYHRELSSNDMEDELFSLDYEDDVHERRRINMNDNCGSRMLSGIHGAQSRHKRNRTTQTITVSDTTTRKEASRQRVKDAKSSKGYRPSPGYKESKSGGHVRWRSRWFYVHL